MAERAGRVASLAILVGLATASAVAAARSVEPPVLLVQAAAEVPPAELLDVGVRVFRLGIPEAESPELEAELAERGVFREIRRGEARLFPLRLARALESSGHWGAVRVIPAPTDAVDLTVSGTIVESTGRTLVLEIVARDASGERWLTRKYKSRADPAGYAEPVEGEPPPDPFQSLFHQIANDLLEARRELEAAELARLREIAFLRFAADLAPASFADDLERGARGRYRVASLPAEGDPMVDRIAEIRERDYLLVDILHEQYVTFAGEMEEPYRQWRAYSYEEEVALAKLRKQSRMAKIFGGLAILGGILADGDSSAERAAKEAAVIGGTLAVQAGFAKSQEARIHREAIRELAASFDSEVAPMVVEVEGRTLRLTGSAATQYEEWRRLLREILATETGLPPDPDTSAELETEETGPR
ncbi:MAG: hypothetical protein R3325_11045 [Thermoanaerobaculia bacterium]|nr:hypothetical protein [Thermoanaerobaculia bacterium]